MRALTTSTIATAARLAVACCLVSVSLSMVGCGRHLMNVALRTPVSVRLDTPVEMHTDVTTELVDNAASPIKPTPISLGGTPDTAQPPPIALLDVDGVLLNRNRTGLGSMGENPVALFREKLDAIERSAGTRAVIMRINSPGGGVTASDIMRQELIRFRQRTGIPVVACSLDTMTGGAFYIATACDAIVAHPTSVVGGVGVVLNIYNLEDTMAQVNVLAETIRAGSKSDAGSPVRAMDEDEKEMLQGIADRFHQRFRDAVLASRQNYQGDPDVDFDGGVFDADSAVEMGLVDRTGYLQEAAQLASQLAGCPPPNRLNLYRRENDRARTPYDITPNTPLHHSIVPFSIPGLDRSQMPTFLYLWQVEPTFEK